MAYIAMARFLSDAPDGDDGRRWMYLVEEQVVDGTMWRWSEEANEATLWATYDEAETQCLVNRGYARKIVEAEAVAC